VVFEWHSCFKTSQVSIEDERSGWPSTYKTTENVEKIWELINEVCRRTIHELTDTVGISYGEILTENLNMELHCSIMTRPPTRPWKQQSLWLTTTVIIPHSPYSPNLAPCDFTLFPKLKMKPKGSYLHGVHPVVYYNM
jgi:hypothetical protein